MLSLLAPRGIRSQGSIHDPQMWSSFLGRKTAAGVSVNESVAMTYSAVWACTRIYGALFSVPIFMYQNTAKGKLRATDHHVEKVLRGMFNPELEASNGRRLLSQWQVNWGNAACEVIRDDNTGDLRELWPLKPWLLSAERNEASGELRWKYRNEKTGNEDTLRQDQVWNIPNIISHDGIVGCGTIRAARETIGFGLGTEKYGANFFGGDGVPRLVITTKGAALKDEHKKSFRDEWKTIMSGPDGSRVATLGGDATVTPITISQEDSQFLETRQHNIEEVARWYGVPPHLIWRMVQVTYNNAEILPLDFVKWTGLQYYDCWESSIRNQLLREDEREEFYAKHNLNALLRGDSKSRVEFYRGMTGIGAYNRNRVLELEDEEPVEGGDTYLVQGATVPLDEDGKPESEFAGSAGAAPPTPPKESTADALVGIFKLMLEKQTPPATNNDQQTAAVKRALHYQLTKMSEREGKRATEESRKAGTFVTQVDGFYVQHFAVMTDAVTPLLEAVGHASPTAFIATWCEAGKQAVLAAADVAKNAAELETSVRAVLDAKFWADRPLKAITSLEN